MEIIPVYARKLTVEHLPVLEGHVAELISVATMDGARYVRWVRPGSDLDVEPRTTRVELDALVPCVRRSEFVSEGR